MINLKFTCSWWTSEHHMAKEALVFNCVLGSGRYLIHSVFERWIQNNIHLFGARGAPAIVPAILSHIRTNNSLPTCLYSDTSVGRKR